MQSLFDDPLVYLGGFKTIASINAYEMSDTPDAFDVLMLARNPGCRFVVEIQHISGLHWQYLYVCNVSVMAAAERAAQVWERRYGK